MCCLFKCSGLRVSYGLILPDAFTTAEEAYGVLLAAARCYSTAEIRNLTDAKETFQSGLHGPVPGSINPEPLQIFWKLLASPGELLM